jgi:DNA helicase II / ATP-dependent DNA helicase PcrA
MGFELEERQWEGYVAYKLQFYSNHTKTVRYRCLLETQAFDFYAPLPVLSGLSLEKFPESLQVVLWSTESPIRPCEYGTDPGVSYVESGVLKYEYKEAKVNSNRYDCAYDDQTYAIYIPNEIFGGKSHPDRIYLQIAIYKERPSESNSETKEVVKLDEIRIEEEQKLADTIHQIDSQIEYYDSLLHKTKDETGGREQEVKIREVNEQYKGALEEARPNPYFGRIDFTPDSIDYTPASYYIGRYHIPINHVYSWGSPVADLFYDPSSDGYHIKGLDKHVSGIVTLKRQITIDNAILQGYQDEFTRTGYTEKPATPKPSESPLTKALSQPKTSKMHDIVETLLPDQYKQIKSGLEEVLIIQGVAGSGKSEIGIHRLAYLLLPQREIKLNPEEVIIFGPSQVFLAYISAVLPGLNVPSVRQRTVTNWLKNTLSHKIGRPAKDVLEAMVLKGTDKNLDRYIKAEKIKSSLKMAGVLENHVSILKDQYYRNTSDIIINGKIIVKKEQVKKEVRSSNRTHLNELRTEILSYVIREARRYFSQAEIEKISKQIDTEISRFWPEVDFLKEYRILISSKDILIRAGKNKLSDDEIQTLVDYGLKHGKNKLTDMPALSYLDHLLNDRLNQETNKPKQDSFSHIVVDEAQDVSPLTLQVIKLHSKNNSFTILGDSAQHVLPYSGISDWNEIRKFFPRDMSRILKAPVSYRSTYEITSFARVILKIADPKAPRPQPYRRHGDKVKFISAKSFQESAQLVAKDVNELKTIGFKTIAVLCKTAAEVKEIQRGLTQSGITDISLLDKQQTAIASVLVGTILMSKGLEFDAVLVMNVNNKKYPLTEVNNKLLYLAVTRTAHVLHIYWYGKLADILVTTGYYKKPKHKNR